MSDHGNELTAKARKGVLSSIVRNIIRKIIEVGNWVLRRVPIESSGEGTGPVCYELTFRPQKVPTELRSGGRSVAGSVEIKDPEAQERIMTRRRPGTLPWAELRGLAPDQKIALEFVDEGEFRQAVRHAISHQVPYVPPGHDTLIVPKDREDEFYGFQFTRRLVRSSADSSPKSREGRKPTILF